MTPQDIDRMVAAGFTVEELAGAVKASFLAAEILRERQRLARAARKHPPRVETRGLMSSTVVTHFTRMTINTSEPSFKVEWPALHQQGKLRL